MTSLHKGLSHATVNSGKEMGMESFAFSFVSYLSKQVNAMFPWEQAGWTMDFQEQTREGRSLSQGQMFYVESNEIPKYPVVSEVLSSHGTAHSGLALLHFHCPRLDCSSSLHLGGG